MTEITNKPALRFPEFNDKWERKILGDLGNLVGGGTPSTKQQEYWNGHIPWISSSDLIEGNIKYINIYRYITEDAIKNSATKLIPEKSILIVSRVGVGKIAVNEIKICTSQDFQSLILKDHNYIFVAFLLQIKTNKLIELNQGTSIKGFVKDDLESLKLFIPSLLEQTKIADFLTSIDTKINQITKKKKLLESYKKSVMQKIFSQEIRFKDDDGNDYPEWEEKFFGEIYTFYSTNSFSRNLLNYDRDNVKNIHYGDIHTKYKSNFDITKENVPYINKEVDLSKISDDCYCKAGDLVIADASEDYKDIGKTIEIINIDNQKLIAGTHTYLARDNKYVTSLGFMGYMMQVESIRIQMMTMATGISVLGISKSNLSKVNISLPSKHEQTKIANFLTSIDKKIDLVNLQLEKVKAWKQGLLQQMFI